MPIFDTALISRIQQSNDIVDVIGEHLSLKRKGREMVGLCPFHEDREHPNLHVYPADRSWCCYVCGKQSDGRPTAGDVIRFVQLIERINFPEACRRLLGTSPSPTCTPISTAEHRVRRQWDRLSIEEQDVLNRAAAHYHQALHDCGQALAYVRGRGIPDWLIEDQQLGYADGHSLRAAFRAECDVELLFRLGLLNRPNPDRPDHITELFRHRVVFPELRGGSCIWLIGRTLVPDHDDLKYLALGGERPVVGLERASAQSEVLMCEGVFDFLTALAWGFPAFSICGTYLPADRLGFLARSSTVYAAFDPDAAGRLASCRFGELLGSRLRHVALPPGCDLNDLGARSDGREQFLELLAGARSGLTEVHQCT